MSIYNITCPNCGRLHQPQAFGLSGDYRCYKCKWGTPTGTVKDGSVFDGNRWHQVTPRAASLQDICDWRKHNLPSDDVVDEVKKSHATVRENLRVAIPLPYRYRMMDEVSYWREMTLDGVRKRVKLGRELRAREEQVSKLQQQLDEQEVEMKKLDQLESELRSESTIRRCYERAAARRLAKMKELENTVKVNGEFIERQAQRLQKAREMVTRMATAAGLYPPNDGYLDP